MYRVEHEDGGGHWLKIGRAFPTRNKTGYTLIVDAIPLNFNGKILLSVPFNESNERPAIPAPGPASNLVMSPGMDDDDPGFK